MAYLYRFKCEPNWPVCTGEMIFFTETFLEDDKAMEAAKERAEGYFNNLTGECSIEYIGEFHPVQTNTDFGQGIITLQNGEY